jgi:hypothetical protein
LDSGWPVAITQPLAASATNSIGKMIRVNFFMAGHPCLVVESTEE